MNIRSGVRRAGASVPTAVARGTLALGVVVLGVFGCARTETGPADTPDAVLSQLQKDRARIDQTTDSMLKRIEEYNASRKPGEPMLQFSEVFQQDFTPEQKDVLNALMDKEQDVSYRALLQKIVSDRDSIQNLQEEVMRLEQTLPDPFVVARRGDSQHELAMTYLTQEAKLDAAKAKRLLDEVDQTDELLPGNKVWFFYDPQRDTFRTYVTQGEAGQTPLAVRRARQRKLIEERDAFKQERDAVRVERDTAQQQVTGLEQVKAGLEGEIDALNERKTALETEVAQLSDEMAVQENSLYFHAASERTLREEGVLSPVRKRLQDVKGVRFDDALDLREATTIHLEPAQFGLAKIREVRMLPPIYREGRDFTVRTRDDHSGAEVVILDPDLFRGKEVVLAVRG